jgi:hypothetical protein
MAMNSTIWALTIAICGTSHAGVAAGDRRREGAVSCSADERAHRRDDVRWIEPSSDGQRFLINLAGESASPQAVTVKVNWPLTLKR